MKILLVQSPLKGNIDAPIFPLGLAYLAAFLNNHEVRIYDTNVEEESNLWNIIDSFRPDIIGISLRNIDNQNPFHPLDYYGDFRALSVQIKSRYGAIPIVVGGAGFSMFAMDIMKANPHIDFGIALEAEKTFSTFLENIKTPESVKGLYYRKDEEVYFTGYAQVEEFKSFPAPRRDLFDIDKYKSHIVSIGVQTKRGCPLKCSYCNYPTLNGAVSRLREAKGVVDEVEELVNRYKVKEFIFADSVFNLPVKHAESICREIIKREIKASWICWLDIKNTTKELLLLLKEAGCVGVSFSPDGLSSSSLMSLNKGIKESDVWAVLKLFTFTPELKDIEVYMFMFINTPGETTWGMVKILIYKFTALLVKIFMGRRFIVSFNWIRIEPSTELYKIALESGVINREKSLLQQGSEEIKSFFYYNKSLAAMNKRVRYIVMFAQRLKKLLKRG
ncbi:MAG: cobalamin-dependent protein [Candidatus Magnetoovum sp. WYHC-5]|nr:cobalamin-dependent protein [Candidatus Magnetoovum sp. WYHC-5]